MKIKKLTAGLLACALMAVNLSTVCSASETEAVNNTVITDTAAVDETDADDNDTVQDSGESDSSIVIPYASIEAWLAAISESADTTESNTVTTGMVNVSGDSYLNLRSGSGMDYDVIGHLFAGDEVEIVGEDGDWYEVVVSEHTGYVYKDYVDVSEQTITDAEMDNEMMELLLYLLSEQAGTDEDNASSDALTPDGNLTLVDDYTEQNEDGSGKQFITVTTKNGNYFYLVIDRDEDGNENVHFMNLVDEADLLALMDEDEAAQYTESVEPEESVEAEPDETDMEDDEPVVETEEESATNMFPVLILVIAVLGGGGFFAYTKLKGGQKKPHQGTPDPDADYLDGEDESDFDIPEGFDEDDEDEDESTMFDAEDNEPV